jgi:hypothetical protein
MFGGIIPILFPLAMLAFLIQYLMETLCFAYSYKQPPMYDEKLSNSTLSMLKWVVPLNLLVTFWAYTNQ